MDETLWIIRGVGRLTGRRNGMLDGLIIVAEFSDDEVL